MAESTAGDDMEHCVQIPAAEHDGAGQLGGGTPERQLNCFVRSVALIERVGNALGTLAFTWATVVLLGGYPTVLWPGHDFWIATAIVFLEAARMFSRNNRMDYQLLFGTRGAVRPLGWNGLVVIVCFTDLVSLMSLGIARSDLGFIIYISFIVILFLLVFGHFLCPGRVLGLRACNPLRRAVSLWSPVLAILLLGPSVPNPYYEVNNQSWSILRLDNSPVKWILYAVLFVVVLLLTISKMKFPSIIRLVDRVLGSKQVFWRRLLINLCMTGAIGILVFRKDRPILVFAIVITLILVVLSLGNLQIPAAFARVFLALLRLIPHNYYGDDANNPTKNNLGPSLYIFYGMVFGQGLLYTVACILEVFSFIPRRFLVRRGGFRGQWGVDAVNLYYAYAFRKCMEGGMLAPNKINITNFAMESLNSDSSKNQLYGIRMLHSLLQREPTRTRLLSKLTMSSNTMARLIRMLDCTSPRDTTIRLFAAKITDELAKSLHLRVVTNPGLIEAVSGLMDYGYQRNRGNPLLQDIEGEQYEGHDKILNAADNQDERQDAVPDSDNLLQTQDHPTQQVGITEQNSWMLRFRQKILGCWSIPQEEPPTDQDLLPALGMSIVDSLAYYDQNNCLEISRATDLIPKIIGFTRYKSEMMYTDAQQKVLVRSSLKVLHRLTGIDGEIGITLRQMISKHMFLLRNLSKILGDSSSSQELKKLVTRILRNLAVDGNMRQEIGHIEVIISRLMHAFLSPAGPSSTNDDRLLRKVAGQALAMLAMESVDNCMAMIREAGYVFIKELTTMIHDDRYRCVAASLLRNMCLHARSELKDSDLKEPSCTLREILERIMDVEGAELEILIGLSSQICQVIPEDFARELEHGQIKERFVKRLIDALNANMEPSVHCPGIRRVILDQVLSMAEHESLYADYFNDHGIVEALQMVEETASKAENYGIFLGDPGFMEYGEPLASLVARTKQVLSVHSVR